jgi:bacterioferritin-associated ferredoxin
MYVCLCNAITDREFRAHAAGEVCTVSMVYPSLGTNPKCGKCVAYVKELLRQVVETPQRQLVTAAAG